MNKKWTSLEQLRSCSGSVFPPLFLFLLQHLHIPSLPPTRRSIRLTPRVKLYGTNLSEVDGCQWRSNAQAPSPVWLPYHSLWLIQWQSLHYAELCDAIITSPPPGPCSGRPWPYRPIILPRRSLTQKRLIYSATSASNMTPLWIFELYVLTSIVRDACGAVAGPVCAEPKRAAGAYCLDGAPLCGCARYTPPLHLIKPHDRNLEFPFFSPAAQAASVSAPKLFLSAFGVLPPPLR